MSISTLMTAEEYLAQAEYDRPTELVRGEVLDRNPPASRHGQICSKVARILGNYADEHQLGHVLSNDAGIITQRDPDTLRADEPLTFPDILSEYSVPVGRFFE